MSDSLSALGALVCKTGVGLGGLTVPQREFALAVPALALADDRDVAEADANHVLQAALAGPASFLDTDHVELRRWLVDTGWWQRDGYGRAYRRTPADRLRPALATILAELPAPAELSAWIDGQRAARRQAREARRAAWAGRPPEAARG